MKKVLLGLLVTVWAFATVSAETFTVDGLSYLHQSGSVVSVTSGSDYATTLIGELTIPGEVEYNGNTYTVTAINYRAFNACNALTSVILPESVKYIYMQDFYNCENLVSIHLPSNLYTIGSGAFQGCKSLNSITIPASVQNIDGKGQLNSTNRGPFYGCDNLETIVVESGNQKYDSRDNCNAVVETATNTLIFGCKGSTIPASVIIGRGSFKSSTITDVVVPEGVTTIENDAFNSSMLQNITFEGEGLTSIGDNAFSYCPMLETITLPNSIKKISNGLFRSCQNLKTVNFSESLESIEAFAFMECPMLKTFTFPASLQSIASNAFRGCTALADIYAYPAGGNVTLNSDVWLDVNQAECNLHVYPADYDYYSTADQWKEFNVKGDLGVTIADVYILGEVDENSWAANVGKKMELDGATGLYTAQIACDGRNEGYNYFSFTTALAENNDDGGWAYIAPFRFGAVSEGDFLVTDEWIGNELSLTYEGGQAYKIPAGEYNLSLNLETMKLIITKNGAAEFKLGDVNADGNVDIEDMNIIINIMLETDSADNYDGRANVNGDEKVDIEDMNAVINIMLSEE